MDAWFVGGAAGGSLAVPPQIAVPTEGSTVVMTIGQQNGSLLLAPAGNLNAITVILPNPPRDGQIITIGSKRNITAVSFTPTIPGAPGGWAADDNYQFKWYDNVGHWVLLK